MAVPGRPGMDDMGPDSGELAAGGAALRQPSAALQFSCDRRTILARVGNSKPALLPFVLRRGGSGSGLRLARRRPGDGVWSSLPRLGGPCVASGVTGVAAGAGEYHVRSGWFPGHHGLGGGPLLHRGRCAWLPGSVPGALPRPRARRHRPPGRACAILVRQGGPRLSRRRGAGLLILLEYFAEPEFQPGAVRHGTSALHDHRRDWVGPVAWL